MDRVTAEIAMPRRVSMLVAALAVAACACGLSACHGSSKAKSAGSSTTALSTTTTTRPAVKVTTTVGRTAYHVQRGDTLTRIAKRFHVTVPAIVQANHLANPDQVAEGQVLVIPAPIPLRLTILPARGPAGATFRLLLVGAQPNETIHFTIAWSGGTFSGAAHLVPSNGAVATTYRTSPADPPGLYRVAATGTSGTKVQSTFTVVAPSTTTTPTASTATSGTT
jgi:LysM repeat protein